jgi:hypothetical protein
MRTSALTGITVAATALGLLLSGCNSDSKPAAAPHTSAKLAKPAAPDGPHPTIADYLRDHKITEAHVHRGDPGTPKVELPTFKGWKSAGDDTPDWAYDALIPSGSGDPKDQGYTPSVTALLAKLTGTVNPEALLEAAPGELQNLPEFKAPGPGSATTMGNYPAYQIAGTWVSDGKTKFVAQRTVIIPAGDTTYVLQLNSDGLADQAAAVQAATAAVGQQTKITLPKP